MRVFAGIETENNSYDKAEVLLQSIPYDGTSTWGKGADKAFTPFLDALDNLEIFDIETASEVYKKGIHILPELSGFSSPEDMFQKTYTNTQSLLKTGKFLSFFGGEHSISIGIIKAFYEKFHDISIVQLDAHADLRPSYMGTEYNHACALYDASVNSDLYQVGIRSMDKLELEYLNEDKCYFANDIRKKKEWMDHLVSRLKDKVYISLDLDVLDPSIMPSTGTPEPGGLDWYTITEFLRKIFERKNVLGFDIVELAPVEGLKAPDFLVAKLYYKMLSYKYYGKR